MNKYVSPIVEIELIDVEDIVLTSGETGEDNEGNQGGNTGGGANEGPLMPFDVMDYYNI